MFSPTLTEIQTSSQQKALQDAKVRATSQSWVSSECSNRGKGKKSHGKSSRSRFIERIERRNRLKAACYDFRRDVSGAVGLGKKLAKCIQGVSFKGGLPNAYHFNCKDKACSFCREYRMGDERKFLRQVLIERVNAGALMSFTTLTIRTRPNETPAQTRARVQSVWSKMIRHPYLRRAVVGAFRVIETTKNNESFHAHIHALVEINDAFTHTQFRKLLRQYWMMYGGGFIHARRIDKEMRSSFKKLRNITFEVSSYATKGNDLALKDWVRVAVAGRGKRDFGWMGLWKKLKAKFRDIVKVAKGEPMKLPKAPSPIEPNTGEVAWLPDGRYKAAKLIKLSERGDWSASWAIGMLIYSLKWSQHPDYNDEVLGVRALCFEDEKEAA